MSVKKVDFKVLSSLEKCFLDDDLSKKSEISRLTVLKNEKLSFQLAYTTKDIIGDTTFISLVTEGELKEQLKIGRVMNVACTYPVIPSKTDDYYLRKTPGLYPDLILPISYNGRLNLVQDSVLSLWVDLELPEGIKAGEYSFSFSLTDANQQLLAKKQLTVEVLDALLPDDKFPHIEWFYCDCLAEYYDVEMFSERHWEIIESYVRTAAENEINIILTPIITPALDTYEGGERMTSQLLDIYLDDGEYTFDFSKLERWIKMCRRLGINGFEMPPLFTQWGAKNAPKIMGYENGEYKRIFGWETDAASKKYLDFLSKLIPALLNKLHECGVEKKDCYFHISDEPDVKHIEMYRTVSDFIKELLKGYTILDAVWSLDLYCSGVLSTPVISTGGVENFKKVGAHDYWVYYCGGSATELSNRYLSMPLARTRMIGIQMYCDGAKGFLHWGYNYYHNRFSYDTVNPYLETGGEYFAPGGDTFIVYPGENGKPVQTIRLKAMRDAMQDIKALKLCESLYGREYVISLLHEGLDYNIDYKHYPHTDSYLLTLREKINRAIAEKK